MSIKKVIMSADGYTLKVNSDGALYIASDVQIPIEIQGRFAQTIQTHNAVSMAVSSSSSGSWIDTNGFDKVAVTWISSVLDDNIGAQLHWSNDGTSVHGRDALATISGQEKSIISEIKARYMRIQLQNKSTTVAQTTSAWAYLKA